ncbi:MAG: ATP-dependent DNA helicase [Actinomycetota bacterium]|nr:ATP-dependent DNA helicase [Actinomycetota bacterium]
MSLQTPVSHTTAVGPESWDSAITNVEGSQLVVGGPGTGKTEFLVRRAIHLLAEGSVRPEAITILGFSRRGVDEFRSRIRTGMPATIGALDVATFHSYAARLVELHAQQAGWDENPQILTGPEQIALVHNLLLAENPASWSPAFAQLLGTQTFAKEVTDFILRAAEQMHTPETLDKLERADWKGLPQFTAAYNDTLRSSGRIDYGTLIATAVNLLESSSARSTGPAYVLVDEYQDTTAAQVRLLQALQSQGRHILAAADPYQSIYSFRGATVENVAAFENAFGSTSRPATRVLLTTSFRTPATILEAAVGVTTGDLPGATGAVIPAPGRGAVEAYLFDQQVEEAEWIAAEAQRLHLAEGVPYSKIGVFVRSKRRLLSDLSRALERRHIPHDLPGSRLTDQPAVRFLLDLTAAATRCDGLLGAKQALRRVLLGSRVGLTIGAFRALERHVRESGSWADSIRSNLPDWAALAALLEDPTWASELPAGQGMWHVWSELPEIDRMVIDPEATEERAAWRSLAQVLARWEKRNPTGTLLDYRTLAQSEDFEAQPLLSYRRPHGDRLTLTTLHQAKGLELDVAFLADAVDGVFPDLRTRDSLLGVRHLLPYVPTETAEYRAFRLQEESRLAYTAMTRARRRVIWTATERGLDGGPGRPSRFFSKMADLLNIDPGRPPGRIEACVAPGQGLPAGARLPVTPREAESALRRCLTEVGTPAPTRLAALTTLAGGDQWGMRPPHEFNGVARRGPDDGLIGPNPLLSPSQAQSYEQCPRRYALERRLKVGSDSSLHATFGTLIHDVLETVEQRAIEAHAGHSTIEDALEELGRQFDPEEFGGSPFADSWALRAWEGLTKLYEKWPAPARRAGLVEHQLDTEIAGVRWTGRADRIDVSPDGVTVVDYKTGRTAVSTKDAAESLQLGFYALAAMSDEAVTELGDVVGAELWYPMTKAKSVTTRKIKMEGLGEVRTRLATIAAGIIKEDWSPTPGPQCERCGLRPLCPVWADGGPEFQ